MEATSPAKRKYTRRTEEERIAELEKKIADLKQRQAAKSRKDDPIVKGIPKVVRSLRKFAQVAMDNKRPDIANTTSGFAAALDRILRAELGEPLRKSAPPTEEN